MGKAILSYTLDKKSNNDANELILISGSLRMVDNCTRLYENTKDMRQGAEFKERIDNFVKRNEQYTNNYNDKLEGEFSVSFIMDSEKREYLPLYLNDKVPIRTRTSALEEVKSEVEKARKLLFRSRDKLFLRKMLADERFADTTDFDIKLRLPEYNEMVKRGYKPKVIDGEYYLTIHEILESTLKSQSLGLIRGLVEDALEVWKEKLLDLDDELLYYYSRHLRINMNEYNVEKLNKKLINNLKSNISNMINMIHYGYGKINRYPVSGKIKTYSKTKKIEDSFA